ncbi:hypothetical protein AOPFMNJM_4248 [Methylobacterium jeotgali]|uniref:Uncharacterized protein n=1 Tax=Methylobacterium jeotgali TaxID=381630 RepID=A0ABQ4T4R1_9HYPH|nr:hypothetical protein AwMethylo_11490 [Methylobacterium sp.]GJE08901.1 hypothetical protein AOPFMNJM_4248 [Methylobacterium jeotgali]
MPPAARSPPLVATYNLYSVSRSQDEIRRLFEIDDDRAGNLPLPSIFPDQMGPVTCPANGVDGPVHPKAMPVLLTDPEE